MSPSPKRDHQWCIQELFAILKSWISNRDFGEVYIAPFDVVLDADSSVSENIVQPDLMFVSKDRLNIITEDNIRGAPDLVIEVLSDSTARYDRVGKMRAYIEFGVKEYWIIDTEQKTLEAFDLTSTEPVLQATLAESDVFKPKLFSGLEISLTELWYPE